ncbi:PAS domain S-box protein [Desulfobotulus sp. H1]|uniref:histidine kinase n=1 Tax=Desulfobotulus pelophilus TaxID=2823377 RepID=A0ABT3N751_9BACT|nr:PAS domain S-box protein [Desulfobotulus pelophilus]MCW7753269.1 PAS domain S-box protein [Desulfobotulus pelophilus]
MMYLDLVLNLALLIALSVLSGFISRRWPRTGLRGSWLQGCLFGTAAVIGMLKPLVLGPGLIFDGRSLMVSLCALFYGPLAAMISALMPILCRIQLGGTGTFTGILVILSSMGIGLSGYFYLTTRKTIPSTTFLFLFGLVVHLVMLGLMLTLPKESMWLVLQKMALPILLIYPVATLLAGKVLTEQEVSAQSLYDLENAKKNLDTTLQSIGDAVIATNLKGHITFMNPEAEKLTGWTSRDAIPKPFTDIVTLIHTKNREPVPNPVGKVLLSKQTEGLDHHTILISRDGTERQITDSAAPIFQDKEILKGVVFVFRDVTEEHLAMEKLMASEALLRMAGRMARMGGWSVDMETDTIFWSEEVALLHGMPPGFCPSPQEGIRFYAPEWREKIKAVFMACQTHGLPYDEEMEIINARGERVWVRTTGEAIRDTHGKIIRVQGAFQDISEHKKTENELSSQALLLREMGSIARIGGWEFDPDTGKGSWTHEVARIHDLDPEETTFLEKGLSFYTEQSRQRIEKAIRKALSRQQPYDLTLEMISAKGARKWVRTIGQPVVQDGRVVQLRGTFQDITLQKESEDALLASEEDYRRLFEDHSAVKLILDPDTGAIADANHAAANYYGWSRDELKAMHMHQIHILPAEKMREDMESAQRQNRTHFEFQHRRSDGSIRDVTVFASRIRIKNKDYIHSIIQDISERKRLEHQLLQSQKLESIGRLAGGIAHDFNNMLGIIIGHSELLEKKLDPSSNEAQDLKEIKAAANRSANLTRQLLAFARQQTINPQILNLNQVIEGMLRMLRRLIGEGIDLRWHPGDNLRAVKMDPSQVDQILANLTINAKDAISDIGLITIETTNVRFDESYCQTHADFLPGDYVMLAVSDDGCGIEKEIIPHLFEPFFTTKPQNEGTGLGLAMVYGIIRQNQGFINVYSEPGQGSTFRIYIPGEKDAMLPKTMVREKPAPGGEECILVVEDEPALLRLTSRMLQQLGYTTLSAAGPAEALMLSRDHTGQIHLLLTDVVMPEMNGRDLAEKLTQHYPQMNCLFMSGYTANVIAHHGVLKPDVQFIQKPFSIKQLAEKIRTALGQ